jgi:hypothetical protein
VRGGRTGQTPNRTNAPLDRTWEPWGSPQTANRTNAPLDRTWEPWGSPQAPNRTNAPLDRTWEPPRTALAHRPVPTYEETGVRQPAAGTRRRRDPAGSSQFADARV